MSDEPAPGDDPRLRKCATCGRVLEFVQSARYYRHTSTDRRNEDHPPVPVPLAEGPTRGRCDFCFAEDPAWVLPVRQFKALPHDESSPDWATCTDCKVLIEANQWNALLRRAVVSWESRNGRAPDLLVLNLKLLYRDVRKNVTGGIQPNPHRGQADPPTA